MSRMQFGKSINTRMSSSQKGPISRINVALLEIDSNFVIQRCSSKVLESLLGESQLKGKNFAALIRDRASELDFKKSLLVLDKLVRKQNIIASVIKHNPFDCLRVKIPASNEREVTKYIRCEFTKSESFESTGNWAVKITDISKSVRISKLIKKSNEKSELKVSTIMSLLKFEQDLVKEFIEATISSLKNILENLSTQSMTSDEVKEKLENIFGIVHQIKGDAAILTLKTISTQAHDFETLLSGLSVKKDLSRKDLKCLIEPLKSIIDAVREVRDIFEKIVEGGWKSKSKNGGDGLMRRLKHLVKRLEEDSKKRVLIVDNGYIDSVIPSHLRRVVSSLVTQLARNAVIHGIEDARIRVKRHKTSYGCLHIGISRAKGKLVVTMRDDGCGIDVQKIKKAALASDLFNKKQVLGWSNKQLLSVLFKPGFSTAKSLTQHAGRGVGLDVIKSTVEKYGGTIGIKSSLNQFTEFAMSFPVKG